MIDPMDEEPKPQYNTPEQLAAARKEAEDFVNELHEKLPPEEFEAWVEAYLEDLQRNIDAGEREIAWTITLRDILRKYGNFENAIEEIKKDRQRTPEELHFLRVVNRMKQSGLLK